MLRFILSHPLGLLAVDFHCSQFVSRVGFIRVRHSLPVANDDAEADACSHFKHLFPAFCACSSATTFPFQLHPFAVLFCLLSPKALRMQIPSCVENSLVCFICFKRVSIVLLVTLFRRCPDLCLAARPLIRTIDVQLIHPTCPNFNRTLRSPSICIFSHFPTRSNRRNSFFTCLLFARFVFLSIVFSFEIASIFYAANNRPRVLMRARCPFDLVRSVAHATIVFSLLNQLIWSTAFMN